jgi:two-component system chemotaxis response regulator CheB
MKVLILANQEEYEAFADHLTGAQGEIIFIRGQDAPDTPKDPAEVDAIIGGRDYSPGSLSNDLVLGWRTHPHTYLIPCWFLVDKKSLESTCLWPGLAIDRYDPHCEIGALSDWLWAVVEWQQNRMHFSNSGLLMDRSGLELATSLCLRRATGVLSVYGDAGDEGEFFIRDGNLVSASFRHLREVEAFYEFLCLPCGGYAWDSGRNPPNAGEPHPLSQLIPDGLKLICDANFLYHFVSSPDQRIRSTDSQSALDDSAAEHFREQKEIYGLIRDGLPVSQITEASPLSRPSTMALLAKWFSLEDVAVIPEQHSENECSVLIVDDSPLLCRVLQAIFEEDPRVRVAGVAHNGVEALRLIGEHKPDVVTLDLQMPVMDGLTALKHILIENPKPVVVISAFTEATSRLTYESFKYGAVDVISKPAKTTKTSIESQSRELREHVIQASKVQLTAARYIRRRKKEKPEHSHALSAAREKMPDKVTIVLCGAGGFPSVLRLVFSMPDTKRLPLSVIAMDMSRRVVEALMANLRKDIEIPIEKMSEAGPLHPEVCYILSNEDHYHLFDDGNQIMAGQNGKNSTSGSFFDELLMSAADSFKSRLVAILLSGTGNDGVEGMLRVKQSGGQVFALAPGACLRPDLPDKAISIGCATEVKDIESLYELFDA